MTKLNKPTMSAQELASKWNMSLKAINKKIANGIKVEKEHSSDLKVASQIARDHIGERPDYYSKLSQANLEEMENPCWKGFVAYGTKVKDGREVPNCIPKKKKDTKMTKKDLVNEAIESILENDLSAMKESFMEALQEKAMEKLDERKQEIATRLFNEE